MTTPWSKASCRTPAAHGARRKATRGMTLIEMLIVVALIALLMGTLVFGSGMFGGADKRAGATLIVAAVRRGLAHANSTGRPVRLALDLAQGRVSLEESSSSEALRKVPTDEELDARAEAAENAAANQAAQEILAASQADSERVLSGRAGAANAFTPVSLLGTDGEDALFRELGKRVTIKKVQTEHDEEPTTEGVAYIYFWPGGMTERAIVQLALRGEDEGLTVVVSPLTGRARIERGAVDLPEGRFSDEEYSEREEP